MEPTFPAFAKARKRVETNFSQLTDQYMFMRNYVKNTVALFARIISKISAQTIAQYFILSEVVLQKNYSFSLSNLISHNVFP